MSRKNHRITVGKLGSGWAAILLADYDNGDGLGEYTDVAETGVGRYEDRASAVQEAEGWARDEGIPLEKGLTE